MTLGALVSIGIAAGTVAFVLAPLFRKDSPSERREESATLEIQELRSHHEMALAALKDLEDDRATGKIGDADYNELRAKLTSQAVETMKRLDSLEEGRSKPSLTQRRRPGKT